MNFESAVSRVGDSIRVLANQTKDSVHDVAFGLIAVTSPLPSAIGISVAMLHNDAHPAVAITMAVAVELGGIAAVWVALRMWMSSRQADGLSTPAWVPVSLVLAYMAVVEGIVVSNESGPALQRIADGASMWSEAMHLAPALYPLMTVIGAVVMAITAIMDEHDATVKRRTEHEQALTEERDELQIDAERQRLQDEIESERQQRQMELQLKRAEHAAKLEEKRIKLESKLSQQTVSRLSHDTVSRVPKSSDPQEGEDRQKRILGHIAEHGDTGASDIAKQVGVGRSTVYRDLEEMERRGELIQVPSSQARRETEYAIPQPELVHTNGSVKAHG